VAERKVQIFKAKKKEEGTGINKEPLEGEVETAQRQHTLKNKKSKRKKGAARRTEKKKKEGEEREGTPVSCRAGGARSTREKVEKYGRPPFRQRERGERQTHSRKPTPS